MCNWLKLAVLLSCFMGVVACATGLNSRNWEEREGAVRALSTSEQTRLETIAFEDTDSRVRAAAVEKLSSESVLAKVAIEEVIDSVCIVALNRITDQSLLVKVAVEARKNVRQQAKTMLNTDGKRLFEQLESAYLTNRDDNNKDQHKALTEGIDDLFPGNRNDLERIRAFVAEYPTGPYTQQVKSKLGNLTNKREIAKTYLRRCFKNYKPKVTKLDQIKMDVRKNNNLSIDRGNCVTKYGVNEQGTRIDEEFCGYTIKVMGKEFCQVFFMNDVLHSVTQL